MSEKRTTPPPRRMGPPGRGPMMPGEKAKDFKGTLLKLMRALKGNLAYVILSFLFAIGSVFCVLNMPNVLGSATDELMVGVMKKEVYQQVNGLYGSFDEAKKVMEEVMEKPEFSELDENATLATFAEKGWVSEERLEGLGTWKDANVKTVLGLIKMGGLPRFDTVRTMVTAMGETNPDAMAFFESIPEKYREAVLDTSLAAMPEVDVDEILRILTLLILLVVTSATLNYVQTFLLSTVAQRMSYQFRRSLNLKFSKLPLSYYDNTTTGEVMSLLTNDVDTISNSLNQSLAQLLSSITQLVGVLIMMLRISFVMTIAAIVTVPLSLLVMMTVVKKSQKFFLAQQKFLGHVNGHIEEMFAGHNVITLFNGEERSIEEFEEYNDKLYESNWKAQFLSGLMMPANNFIGNVGYLVTCVLGGYQVISGNITVGNIQAFTSYIRQFNNPISQMGNIMNTLQSTVAAAERVFDFLELPEEADEGDLLSEEVRGDVTFENVAFGYRPDRIIIKNFSIDVKAGDHIAIVGPTGAGKTTIVKLLMRFYDLNGGRILLDGKDVTALKRGELRTQFGMVLQDTWLFSGSIMDNIRYGRKDATDEEVIAAARAACADHFIQTLPGKYAFQINEEGGNISQGQKQLLTIARALLADPKVLILDEATSSVDTRTEMLIQRAMDRLMEGRTSFIIAHRLSTIREANTILVMKEGDIVEQGNHKELLEKNGFYAELYNSQFEGLPT